ncbi:hypothetical protein KKG63_03370, partial [Patescibacteria group bacterium]|nr:hypothetical protein [Patescibacteria group bacterium]
MSDLVEKSRALVQKYQKDLKRESGESLCNHLEAVFGKMEEAELKDEKVLASALLHHFPGHV